MKSFETAARRNSDSAVANPIPVQFEIDGEILTAHPPSSGQLALFFAHSGGGGMDAVRAMFEFLANVLDEDDYEFLEEKLQEGVDLGFMTEVLQYLIEEWSTRPTKSPSASTASRKSTGKRSTAKRPAKAANTST